MPEKRTVERRRRTARDERSRERAADAELQPDDEATAGDADYDDEEEAPRRRDSRPAAKASGRRARSADHRIPAAEAARAGVRNLRELIGKRPEGITAVEPTDGGWLVGVEVLEDERVPSSADILAVYEAELDAGGELVSYRRVKRYPRGRGDDGDR